MRFLVQKIIFWGFLGNKFMKQKLYWDPPIFPIEMRSKGITKSRSGCIGKLQKISITFEESHFVKLKYSNYSNTVDLNNTA